MRFLKLGKALMVLLLVFLYAAGCVSIPRETSELSVELGNRISAIEKSNITLLHSYFADKRNAIDEFITNEWSQKLTQNFFSDPQITATWKEILAVNDEIQKIDFLKKAGTAIQKQISKKRLELIQPLDDLERKIEMKIREEYSFAYAINNSITSFLISASELAENRNRYLNMIGVTDEKISEIINTADNAVSELLLKTRSFNENVEAAELFKKKIELLINNL